MDLINCANICGNCRGIFFKIKNNKELSEKYNDADAVMRLAIDNPKKGDVKLIARISRSLLLPLFRDAD